MLRVLSLFVLFLAVFGPAQAGVRKLPSYIVPCRRSDPNVNQCIVDHGNDIIPKLKNGDKEFKISPISPFRINEASLEPGANLKLTMRNIDASGLENLKIIKADHQPHYLKLTLELPLLELIGDYEIEGKILILPITGAGRGNITLENMNNIIYELHLEETTKSSGTFYNIKDNTVTFEVGRVYYHFDNLFNGDEALGTQMNSFVNENWKDIHAEFKSSFEVIIASIIKNFVQQFLHKVPVDEVFLP